MIKRSSVSTMLALCLAGGLMGSMAYADDGATEKADPKERVCKRVKRTGTHFTQRVCYTRARWDRIRSEAEEEKRRSSAPTDGESG